MYLPERQGQTEAARRKGGGGREVEVRMTFFDAARTAGRAVCLAAVAGLAVWMYRNKVDYWGIGASGGFLVVGGQFEIHPLQIADWFVGWFTFDPLNDDL